jgi:hypothetical protein
MNTIRQNTKASEFTDRMNNILDPQRKNHISLRLDIDIELPKRDGRLLPPRCHPWTHTHSHYALMGGFVFDIGDIASQERFLPGSRTRVTISPDCLLFLAQVRPSVIPDLEKAEINDKDKAGGFGWFPFLTFFAYCCYLMWQDLPISVMEQISMMFALSGLFSSFLLREKPLNVTRPTLIKDRSLHGLFAYLCFHSTFDDWNDSQHLIDDKFILAEPSTLRSLSCMNCGENNSYARQNSARVIRRGVRQDKAPSYDYNRIDEGFWSQHIATQSKIYKLQDRRRWEMTFNFWHQASYQCQTNEDCCIELAPKLALVDRSSDWPCDLRLQNLWDLLSTPTSDDRHCLPLMLFCCLSGVFFVSVLVYFSSRGSVMGFHVNGLPEGPFVSWDYFPIVVIVVILLCLILSGFVLLMFSIVWRLRGLMLRAIGTFSMLFLLAYVVVRLWTLFEYFSCMRYLVAGALEWA